MPVPTVLLTAPLHPDGAAILAPHARMVVVAEHDVDTYLTLAGEAEGIIAHAKLPDDIVAHAPRLKGIVRHGVGLDIIPVEAATMRGVVVANLPGSNTLAVAEYVFSALMALRRPVQRIDGMLRSSGWAATRAENGQLAELNDATLGILGVGNIGRSVARIARQGFAMRVIGNSRRPESLPDGIEAVSLDQLFERSDILVISCALTDQTRGLVDAARISRMKADAILINVSRGGLVDTGALVDALRKQRLGGAALDVFEIEPLPQEHDLFDCPNLLLTPHIAAMTATSRRRMSVGAAEEMLRILYGEPARNPVASGHRSA